MQVMTKEEMIRNLREYRESKHLSQVDLARLSGLSIDVIRSLETGRRLLGNSKADTLIKLAGALDCRVDDLLFKKV